MANASDTRRPRALLTGASGFIGGRLHERLLSEGCEVVTLVRPRSPRRPSSIEVDYGDVRSLERAVERAQPELVFHVAGVTKGVTYDDFHRGNVVPTENLLQALARAGAGVKRFVHVSSLAAFGPSPDGAPLDESAPRRPIEFYGESKRAAEEAVERAMDRIPATIVRPPGVYGPGDIDYFELFKQAARGLNLFFGNQDRVMSLVYVDDLIEGMLLAARSEGAAGRGYFLCDGDPVSWATFQRQIVAASGRRALTLDLPGGLVELAAVAGEVASRLDGKPRLFNRQKAAMGRQPYWVCTSERARRELGYSSAIERAEGIRRSFEWYRTSGWL